MRRLLLLVVVLAAVGVAVAAVLHGRGIAAASHRPLPFETPVARAAWRWMIPAASRDARNPVSASAEVLADARAHFADHCATCHGNDGSGDSTIGRRVFPRAPDMRAAATQQLTDGELFYAIEQGIPWTAMPGWANGTADGERQSWALVHFVRHLPSITPDELTEMERLNPKPPPDERRDQEIEDFLKGPAPAKPAPPGRGRSGGG